jgi:GNAT superfamily N-acetyltransferase
MEYRIIEGKPDPAFQESLTECCRRIFGQRQSLDFSDLAAKEDVLIVAAEADGHVVGCKIGYRRKPGHFYSWLGGVVPDFRRQGVGSRLMELQHQWCREHGYRTIRTHTKNKWKPMLILNLRHGFDIIGSWTDEVGEPKIILELKL